MDNQVLKLEAGTKVHYCPQYGEPENGIVKSVMEDIVFVVYKCNNEWSRYYDYTGAATHINDIKIGWV